ncbi:hypothetical protein DFJ58DRAFT_847087 [Suillus subalutaceus]|uniref:uncharacterized protein n=1 Tax=Suillus subalutaceus TaxID=48586 RepID=UPI001B872797|nr:uncharacterized protein DFJ58DRAFT_847087 [Suillus subalutaceus]KAG1836203.1 hypothetical protein DFJ58DRAFT_847087 [Suillus subalutaceus]
MYSWSLFRESIQCFQHQARLTTYSGSVHALAVSNDGQAFACGGTEGIKVWDIKSRKELTCSTHNESRGTVSCAVWITTRLAMTETLCYGTELGYIVFLQCSPVDVRMSWFIIEFSPNINQMLFQETCTRRLGLGFEITSFADDKGVYVFGLYDGNFIKLKGDDSAVVKEYSCQSVIGHAAVNQKRVPKQVAFGAEGRLVVGGSDNGLVYIFERKSEKLLETLHHSNAGLVQTIAVVISASQALGRGKAIVNLWVYDYGMKKENPHLQKNLVSVALLECHTNAAIFGEFFALGLDMMVLSADLAQRMRHTQAFFANDLQESVHEAVFDKVLHAQEEVIQEAGGDVGEDVHQESTIGEKDDIAAEAERVFYETLRVIILSGQFRNSGNL